MQEGSRRGVGRVKARREKFRFDISARGGHERNSRKTEPTAKLVGGTRNHRDPNSPSTLLRLSTPHKPSPSHFSLFLSSLFRLSAAIYETRARISCKMYQVCLNDCQYFFNANKRPIDRLIRVKRVH
jgi:hypothetical protein